jgi:hypothetical protein
LEFFLNLDREGRKGGKFGERREVAYPNKECGSRFGNFFQFLGRGRVRKWRRGRKGKEAMTGRVLEFFSMFERRGKGQKRERRKGKVAYPNKE